jgi:hypothetical protein
MTATAAIERIKSASLRFLPALPRMPDVCYFTPMVGSVFKTAPM